MSRVALAVLLVAVTLCLFASPSNGDLVKVYFTVGPVNGTNGATQLWLCNSDGTEPELLLEADLLGFVQADSYHEFLYYSHNIWRIKANLDGSDPTQVGWSLPVTDIGSGFYPFDVNCGYFCYFTEELICTVAPDGSTEDFAFWYFPGIVSNPVLVGVGLHIPSASGVVPPEPTSWGKVKAEWRE